MSQSSLFLPLLISWLTWRNPRLIVKPQRKLRLLLFYSPGPCGPCPGLEGITKSHQPGIRFQSESLFPHLVHAKPSWCWAHQIYCVCTECLHVTHTPARAETCRHPNSFMPKLWRQLGISMQEMFQSSAMLTELETNTYFKSFSSQRQRKQYWEVLT